MRHLGTLVITQLCQRPRHLLLEVVGDGRGNEGHGARGRQALEHPLEVLARGRLQPDRHQQAADTGPGRGSQEPERSTGNGAGPAKRTVSYLSLGVVSHLEPATFVATRRFHRRNGRLLRRSAPRCCARGGVLSPTPNRCTRHVFTLPSATTQREEAEAPVKMCRKL